MFSSRSRYPRFKLQTRNGVEYIRANYHHSFDVDDPDLPLFPDETGTLPTLFELALRQVCNDIRLYAGIGNIGDSYLLNRIWNRLARDGTLSNRVIREFAVDTIEAMDLQRIGQTATISTLLYVAKNCPELKTLNLSRCVALNEQILTVVGKRCPLLEHLNLSHLPFLQPEWCASLGKLRQLETLDLSFCRDLTTKAAHARVVSALVQGATGKKSKPGGATRVLDVIISMEIGEDGTQKYERTAIQVQLPAS